jgi:hypothetical protein
MTVETATYISDLNTSYPAASDPKSEGDDHLRLIKSTVKTTFPNVTGAVTPTHTQLNYVAGVSSAIQTQLDAKAPTASPTFTGTVVLPSTTSIGNVSSTELGYVDGVTSAIQTQLDAKAPLSSPALTGTPTAPTATAGTNTTQLATTAFVTAAAFAATLPSQTGNAGKVITTDGGSASWDNTLALAYTFRAANAIRSEAASTQDAVVLAGRAGGTSSYAVTLTPTTLSANRTVTIPNETFTVGFRNLPAVGTQTGSYTLAVNDVGKYVQVSTGGSITIPTSTFAEGDAITIYNNTTGNITITCSAPTAYIAGTNTVKTSMTLATRGVATVLFYSATACVVSGNVT